MRTVLFIAAAFGISSGFSLGSLQERFTSNGGSSNLLGNVQNSSFGQLLGQGVSAYNDYKNGNGDSSDIREKLSNSSIGEMLQSGMEYFNRMKDNSTMAKPISNLMGAFIPFLANATDEAKSSYLVLVSGSMNKTIAEIEEETQIWAAKYNLTEDVNAFVNKSMKMVEEVDKNSTTIIMNLDNVLNNIKAIRLNKNQTAIEMQTAMIQYIMTLDETTREIIGVLYKPLLPESLRNRGCGHGMIGGIRDLLNQESRIEKTGGNSNLIGEFMQRNNVSQSDIMSIFERAKNQKDDGSVSIQIEPMEEEDMDEGEEEEEEEEIKKNKKNKNKKNKNKKNKNKKKKTVVESEEDDEAVDFDSENTDVL